MADMTMKIVDTPDFDQIAQQLVDDANDQLASANTLDPVTPIVEQLRQVWNARGAADLAAIDSDSIDPHRAIRQLDR